MITPFDYKIPKTLEEARHLLWEAGGKAKIIGGGTDLMISLRKGDLKPPCLIDVTKIAELRNIHEKNGILSVGAAVTHAELASSPLVRGYAPVLSEAASAIGSPQIRNIGTIGGNIVNASPAADTIPPLMVLNAIGKVVSKEGEKELPVDKLFQGPYETRLKPHEILVQISFQKLPPDFRSAFVRLARREAMAIARISVAVVLKKDRIKGTIEEIRISLGAVTPTPHRIFDAEALLKGRDPDEDLLGKASRMVSQTMIQWSGVRQSTSYKAPVAESLFLRAVRKCLEEAR